MARVVSKRPRDRSLFASPLAECADPTSFLLLCAAVFCIFADQNLLAPNLSAIADDLGFDERERDAKLGGQISVAFFLLGLPACLVIGVLTDVARRKDLLVMTVVLGQGPCALAGFVTSFWQLFVLRALTGVAVGGALPLAFSIAGDLFPPTARSHASGTVGLVMHAGVIFGQGVSGYAGPIFGWRAPFVLVAIPGLCVAWLVDKYAVEPRRGGSDGGGASPSASPGGGGVDDKKMGSNGTDAGVTTSFFASDATSTRETATRLAREWIRKSANVWRRRTNALGFTQGIPGTVPWSVINVFMNDYLANEKGLGVQLATTLMMTFSAGCAFGTILGGWLGQRLYNERGWYMTAAMGAFAVAGIFPWLYLIESNDYAPFDARRFGFKLIVAFVGGNLAAVTGVNVRAMAVNVNPPYERGTAFSWFNLTDDLGKGFGPVMSAALIAWLGREAAFKLGICFWLPCGVMCAACGWSMSADEARTKAEVELYGPAGDRELDFEARVPLMGAGVGGSPLGKLV